MYGNLICARAPRRGVRATVPVFSRRPARRRWQGRVGDGVVDRCTDGARRAVNVLQGRQNPLQQRDRTFCPEKGLDARGKDRSIETARFQATFCGVPKSVPIRWSRSASLELQNLLRHSALAARRRFFRPASSSKRLDQKNLEDPQVLAQRILTSLR